MGEVKRYGPQVVDAPTGYGWGVGVTMAELPGTSSAPGWYAQADYARLERERDEAVSVADSMGRDAVEFSAKLAEAQAELTRLRAVEMAAEAVVKEFRSVWRKGDYDLTDAERASLIGLIRVLRPERENEFSDD